MSWTYDPAVLDNTAAGLRNQVRLRIGDTDASWELLQNEEIDYYLGLSGSDVLTAAIGAVRAIIAKFGRQADLWMGHTRVHREQFFEQYRTLLEELELERTSTTVAEIYVGGISIADKESLDANPDAVQPSFSIGADDYPGSSQDSVHSSAGES